jgi:hypothetical protein
LILIISSEPIFTGQGKSSAAAARSPRCIHQCTETINVQKRACLLAIAHTSIAGAAHIRGELINLIKAAVDDSAAESGIPQIADGKIIGFALREFMKL